MNNSATSEPKSPTDSTTSNESDMEIMIRSGTVSYSDKSDYEVSTACYDMVPNPLNINPFILQDIVSMFIFLSID
jgi:hypothetical protein